MKKEKFLEYPFFDNHKENMLNQLNNNPIDGTKDKFGHHLRKADYIYRKLSDILYKFGYDKLDVPIIERADSFSEKIVGNSPWPEWNAKGCFFLEIDDYDDDYNKLPRKIEAVLIPEGTISVTRWLGNLVDNIEDNFLPLKIFYYLPCFRNELLNTVSETKKRQFYQFGLEILGTSNQLSDIEVLFLVNQLLKELEIPSDKITTRLNDINIFTTLIDESGINYSDTIIIKEILDSLAECKAGKKSGRQGQLITDMNEMLNSYNLSKLVSLRWKFIIEQEPDEIKPDFFEIFDKKYFDFAHNLNRIKQELSTNEINVKIDLCVVRSHEYYTGLSFEVDVDANGIKFVEIAGGGRYDKLVSNFVSNSNISKIPSTGFAFGLERVISVLETLHIFEKDKKIYSNFNFKENVSENIIILPSEQEISLYFEAMKYIEKYPEERFEIYLGKMQNVDSYVQYKKYKKTIKL